MSRLQLHRDCAVYAVRRPTLLSRRLRKRFLSPLSRITSFPTGPLRLLAGDESSYLLHIYVAQYFLYVTNGRPVRMPFLVLQRQLWRCLSSAALSAAVDKAGIALGRQVLLAAP